MEVEVRLFANLADYLPPGARGGAARVALPAGATVGDLVRRLGIPAEVPRLQLVNGRDATPATPLADADVVTLLPPLAGGGPCDPGRPGGGG